MKLTAMRGDDAARVLCDLIEPASRILEDSKTADAFTALASLAESFCYLSARSIASAVQNAVCAVTALTGKLYRAVLVFIKGNAVADKALYIFGAFFNRYFDGFLVAMPRTCLEGIVYMTLKAVVFVEHTAYTALSKPG